MTLPCVMALGETRLLFWVSLVYALVHLPAFIAGTILFGLIGTIWSIVAAGVFYTYLNTWLLHRTLGITLAEIWTQLRRPIAAVALMIVVVAAMGAIIPVEFLAIDGSWLSLVTKILVGGFVFCLAQYSIWRLEGRPDGIERRLLQVMRRED
jgi:O-antigen/teichoic acid export membrane protein